MSETKTRLYKRQKIKPKDKDKHNNNIQNCPTAKHQEPSPFMIASITVVTSDLKIPPYRQQKYATTLCSNVYIAGNK